MSRLRNIYSAVHKIIELWENKPRIGEGRPFAIDLDVDYLALDAVLAFTYGHACSNRALDDQLNALNALTDSGIRKLRSKGRTNSQKGGNEVLTKSKPAPIHEDMTATMAEILQSSVSPPLWKYQGILLGTRLATALLGGQNCHLSKLDL